MDAVYVLTYGQAAYEDNVFVVGVYSTNQKAMDAVEPGRKDKKTARYGEYYYDIEPFEVDT